MALPIRLPCRARPAACTLCTVAPEPAVTSRYLLSAGTRRCLSLHEDLTVCAIHSATRRAEMPKT